MICIYILLFRRLHSHVVGSFRRCAEAFWFSADLLVYFRFCCHCFWCQMAAFLKFGSGELYFSVQSFIVIFNDVYYIKLLLTCFLW